MRLLQRFEGGFRLTPDLHNREIPSYAILSHTWGHPSDEVTFEDVHAGTGWQKAGFRKIEFCSQQAARDGIEYFWVDSCCIDKKSSTELQEAINSMFSWYQRSQRCYVYLADVSTSNERSRWTWEHDFRGSRWFTRGWTLQELLAPRAVAFYSKEGRLLGDKRSLETLVLEVTGIDKAALRGASMTKFSVEKRLSWARFRHTTREEDEAYSLFGIFGVFLPILYGEGRRHALCRLQSEIQVKSERDPAHREHEGAKSSEAVSHEVTASSFDKKLTSSDRLAGLPDHDSTKKATDSVGHGAIVRAAFSHNGSTLATSTDAGTITVWKTESGFSRTLAGHTGPVLHLAFSEDGLTLASTSLDGTTRLWECWRGEQQKFDTRDYDAHVFAFSPNGCMLASVSSVDKQVRVWEHTPRSSEPRTLLPRDLPAKALAFSHDSIYLAVGSVTGNLAIFNAFAGIITYTREVANTPIMEVAFSPRTNDILALLLADRTVRLINRWSNGRQGVLRPDGYVISRPAFSTDGRSVAAVCVDNSIVIWSTERGDILWKRTSSVRSAMKLVAFSWDETTLWVASIEDGKALTERMRI